MKFQARHLMNIAVMMLTAGVVISARHWPLQASLFPLVVAIPVFLLALGDLIVRLAPGREEKDKSVVDFRFSEDTDIGPARRRTLVTFAWIAVFFLAVILLGFPASVPLFVFSYLKIQAGERWRTSLAVTACFYLGFWGLFLWLLDTRFPEGWLLSGLRILGLI